MCVIKEIIDNGDGTKTAVLKECTEPVTYKSCMICGNSIPNIECQSPYICDECRQAVIWIKDKMWKECK